MKTPTEKLIAAITNIWPPFNGLGILELTQAIRKLKVGEQDDGVPSADLNSIFVIQPRRLTKPKGIWVFSDAKRGLTDEPFVGEINDMLDWLTREIPKADEGVRVMFSATRFPNHQITLRRVNLADQQFQDRSFLSAMNIGDIHFEDGGGTDYECEELGITGWLCPALLRYFKSPPPQIFGAVMALEQ